VTIKDLQAYRRKQEAAALAVELKKMSPMDC
jgi:3,4-dihydroxy 2-butanone 4-phosphate synthase/GTP cyclohydrolase II